MPAPAPNPGKAPLRLNLGSGPSAVPGWTNVDGALGARVARVPLAGRLAQKLGLFEARWDHSIRIHDLRRPLPWDSESVTAIYSSHTLEHLTRHQGAALLAECERVLAPEGRIRIVVPSLARFVERYTQGEMPADAFVEELGVLPSAEPAGLKSRLKRRLEFPHMCMYDEPALLRALAAAGIRCEPRKPFDSEIPGIEEIERQRFVETSVIVEGQK